MIDLHCHILPGVDDGAINLREALYILKYAEKNGFTQICLTPHFAPPGYVKTKKQNLKRLKFLKDKTKKYNIKVDLYLGNEVFIQEDVDELLENYSLSTIADSEYVLLELPMYQELSQEIVSGILKKIKEKGYKVVIAHPERYVYFQRNPKRILEYFDEDVIFQGNYGSIVGAYGRDAQKAMKQLLKMKKIHYLSTDTHHVKYCIYRYIDDIKKELLKNISKEYFEIITETNPKLILENKDIIEDF